MSKNGSLPKTTIIAPTGGLLGSHQCPDDNVGAPDNNAGNTPSKDTQLGQPTNQIHPPLGYSYLPWLPPFPRAPQFYHPALLTWHQAISQALVLPKDIQFMGHHGKHMISPTEVMVDLKRSPLSNPQDMGHHLQAHLGCIQHRLETLQSFGWYRPPLLPEDNLAAHPGYTLSASQRNNISWMRNHAGQMLQGLPICPHYQIFLMTNTMQIIRETICRTCVVPQGEPQSAWSNHDSPWSHFHKAWGSPTLVLLTSGRKYGWLGFWRLRITPLSGDRTVWNSLEMEPCTGKRLLQILCWHSTTDCHWRVLIMLNGFGDGGLRWFSRNAQTWFGR